MTTIKFITRDLDRIAKLSSVRSTTRRSIGKALFDISKDLKQTARAGILRTPKHGRLYIKKLRGRIVRHRASAPNEDPANFTGALRKSVATKLHGAYEMDFGAGDERRVDYAKRLELGGVNANGSIIEARNYLKRAITSNDRNIQKRIEAQIKKQMTRRK